MGGYPGKLIEVKPEVVEVKTRQEKFYYFEVNEAQIQFVHGGHILHYGATFNDFYGEDTCIEGAVEESKGLCKLYSIDENSSLAIIIVYHKALAKKKKNEHCTVLDVYDSVSSETKEMKVVWQSKPNVDLKEDPDIQ